MLDANAVRELALRPAPGVPESGAPDLRGPYGFARYGAQNDYYVGFYQAWTKTALFLMGKQWVKWLDGPRRYVTDTDVPPWVQQPVTNMVYAVYRTLDAKMSKQRPTLEVVPPSGDSEDRAAANLAEALLQHWWRALKIPQRLRRARGWYFIAGQTYLHARWDAKAGVMRPLTKLVEATTDGFPAPDPMPLDAQGLPLIETVDREVPCDAEGNPLLAEDGSYAFDAAPAMVPEGEIAVSYESPMAIRFNPDAEDPEDATEMFVAKLWPREEAAAHFQCDPSELQLPDDEDRAFYQDLIAAGAAGAAWASAAGANNGTLGADLSEAIGDRVLVLEYYAKPDPDTFPEGRHWISIGPKKVWPKADDAAFPTGEAPLPEGFWPPYIPVIALPVPGQPAAMGSLTQLVPLNEQLNTLDGKIAEHEVTMSMGGKWVVSREDEGLVIDSDPAQILASDGYTAGRPPVQIKPVALPNEIYAERNVLLEKMRMVLSLSEMDLGNRPEGVSAGRAFLVLQEVTDSVLGPDLDAWASALEELGRRMLVLAQRYYRETRTIAIRGDRGRWEVRAFQGADLRDGLDVRVQSASMFPWSKTAQLDTKLNLLSQFKELLLDPETGTVDAQKFARFMDTSGTGLAAFETDEDPDLVEVQREHAMFEAYDPSKGEDALPQLGFWQAHAKHLEAHYTFLKRSRARFDRWSPAAQAAFLRHCQLTAQEVDALAQTMLDAQGGAVGDAPAAMVEGEEPGATEGLPPELAALASETRGGGAVDAALTSPRLQPGDFAAADGGAMPPME